MIGSENFITGPVKAVSYQDLSWQRRKEFDNKKNQAKETSWLTRFGRGECDWIRKQYTSNEATKKKKKKTLSGCAVGSRGGDPYQKNEFR